MDHFATTSIFPNSGETVLGETMWKAPGGKGANQAVQAARLGADVTMVGKLGKDGNGQEMIYACNNAGIDTSHVLFDDELATGGSFIILEKNEDASTSNRIIVIPGANMSLHPDDVAFLEDTIGLYDIVILQMEIPMEINLLVAKYAFAANVPVMLNPAPSAALPSELIKKLTFISPNEHEAFNLTGINIVNEQDSFQLEYARDSALVLYKRGVKNVIITLGCRGAVSLNSNGFCYSPSIKGTCAIDPTAAGDSFVASFCCASCIGMNIEDALCFANFAASLTVSKPGAMPSLPTLDEIDQHLLNHNKMLPLLYRLRN